MLFAFASTAAPLLLRRPAGHTLTSRARSLATPSRLHYLTCSAVDTAPSAPPALRQRLRVRHVHEAEPAIVGSHVTVNGWVRSVRDQKQFAFVDLNDGSSVAGLQVVINAGSPAFKAVSGLTTGCSVSASGTIVESLGKGQRYELQAIDLAILGTADPTYPLQKKRHSLEFLRTIAHLRPRTNAIGAMARVRSALALATHSFFDQNGFLYLNAPIITGSDCEGAGEMFRVTTAIPADDDRSKIPIMGKSGPRKEGEAATNASSEISEAVDFGKDFFGKPTFLTVSGQLSAETYACALSDVYTFGPTFRAENSNTTRHLAEFWMIEPEMAFATLDDDMANAEAYVKHVISTVLDRCAADLAFFDKFVERGLVEKLTNVVNQPFVRVSYTEAVDLLLAANKPNKKGKRRFEFPVEWGIDLQSEHERYLAEEHFARPVFVYNYPKGIKAFYMRDNDDDGGKTVLAMDLLVPGIGELIGGSAREERLDVLEAKIEALGLNTADYDWYLDLRRYGSVPHAGYGLGFERLVLFVTGMENVRDCIPFPRTPGSAEF
jgi:asparaginyl-tRNA synthetase